MDAEIIIRPYQVDDRQAVREICYRTGYMGEPADWYWRDFESFADIWTAYYTDQESESAFVAVRSGRVVGYLLGCVDSAEAASPASAILRQMVRRFLLFRPGTALMHAWFERLTALGSPGCHLVTMAENKEAIAFFERMGFRRFGPPTLVPGMRTPEGERMHQQVMVREMVAG